MRTRNGCMGKSTDEHTEKDASPRTAASDIRTSTGFPEEVMKQFKNILCVVETAEACKPALERAIMLAEANRANLTVVDVVERVAAGIETKERGSTSAGLQRHVSAWWVLEALVDTYRTRVAIQTKVLMGTPFLEIIREVLRNGREHPAGIFKKKRCHFLIS